MRIVLEVLEGPMAGKKFVFERHSTFMVGREREAHFPIPSDRYFSRHHFMIEASPPHCFLRDLDSTNGTLVNDAKVEQVHLTDGDIIRGGTTRIRVRVEETRPAEPDDVDEDGLEDTTLSRFPTRGGLRCAVCGAEPDDDELRRLADTSAITYVCPKHCAASAGDRPSIWGYEIVAPLGKGSLGPVWRARRTSDGLMVALKTIPREVASLPGATQLFLRQMRLCAKLDHANIARVVEMGEAGGMLWIATECVDGPDARKLAQSRGGKLPAGDAVAIILQTLDALGYAHERNMVHRDVKPGNILVGGGPGAYVAKLGDFGLIRHVDEAGLSGITREGEARGSVPFMPPEQAMDSRFVKPEGDLYAAGASLYWLLTGEYVYDFNAKGRHGRRKDPFLVVLEDKVVPIRRRDPSVPEPLAKAIRRALKRDPEARYETAAQMRRALERALD